MPGPTFICIETSTPVIAWFRFDLVLPWQFVMDGFDSSFMVLGRIYQTGLIVDSFQNALFSHVVQLMPSFCFPS